MAESKELSIIIVNYRADQYLKKCLASIKKKRNWEIIVIDNNQFNRGFAVAANLGARQAQGKFLLFLNPDTIVKPQAIETMTGYLKRHPDVGLVGPKLIDSKNQIYKSICSLPTPLMAAIIFSFIDKIWPRNPWSVKYWLKDKNRHQIQTVGAVSGAALMIPKSLFTRLGGFDEKFFLYWEEIDLCRRLRDLRKKVIYLPQAEIIHHGAKSSQGVNIKNFYEASRRHYFQKHYSLFTALFLETFWQFSQHLVFIFLFSLAVFLFTYRLGDLMSFTHHQGTEFLTARNFMLNQPFNFVSLITNFSSFYIYLLALLLKINPSPVTGAYLAVSFGLLSLCLFYFFTANLFSKKIASLATLIMVTSSSNVLQFRYAGQKSLIPLLSLIFLILLYYLSKKTSFFLSLISRLRHQSLPFFLRLVIFLSGFSILIKSPPTDTNYPLYLPLISLSLSWLVFQFPPILKKICFALFIILAVFNLTLLFKTDFLTPITFRDRQQVINFIIQDSQQNPFVLKALGPGSQTEALLDNYRYLLTLQDRLPSSKAMLQYYIYEGDPSYFSPPLDSITYFFDRLIVSKKVINPVML